MEENRVLSTGTGLQIWKDLCSYFFSPTCSVPDVVFSFETCCKGSSLTMVFALHIAVLYA